MPSPSPDHPSDTDTDSDIGGSLFIEPEGFYQPEKPPTFIDFALHSGTRLHLRLVGHNPLWGHHLWNSGRVLAERLQQQPDLVQDKDVLELGAGAGLPGLVAGVLGARRVVITDYPDADLVENLRFNVVACKDVLGGADVSAEGYLWGAELTASMSTNFELLILGDLLFNHSEHDKLVKSMQLTLRKGPDSRALVFFTPYRPWLLEKDLAFFDLAKEGGFDVEKVLEKVLPEVMFKEDRGDEMLRRTVFGYELRWKQVDTHG